MYEHFYNIYFRILFVNVTKLHIIIMKLCKNEFDISLFVDKYEENGIKKSEIGLQLTASIKKSHLNALAEIIIIFQEIPKL